MKILSYNAIQSDAASYDFPHCVFSLFLFTEIRFKDVWNVIVFSGYILYYHLISVYTVNQQQYRTVSHVKYGVHAVSL